MRLIERARKSGIMRLRPGRKGNPERPVRVINQEQRILNMVEENSFIHIKELLNDLTFSFRILLYTISTGIQYIYLYHFTYKKIMGCNLQTCPIGLTFVTG